MLCDYRLVLVLVVVAVAVIVAAVVAVAVADRIDMPGQIVPQLSPDSIAQHSIT